MQKSHQIQPPMTSRTFWKKAFLNHCHAKSEMPITASVATEKSLFVGQRMIGEWLNRLKYIY